MTREQLTNISRRSVLTTITSGALVGSTLTGTTDSSAVSNTDPEIADQLTKQWEQTVPLPSDGRAGYFNSVTYDADTDSFLAVGSIHSRDKEADFAWMTNLNAQGEVGWNDQLGPERGGQKDRFFDVVPALDEGYMLLGQTRSLPEDDLPTNVNGWTVPVGSNGDVGDWSLLGEEPATTLLAIEQTNNGYIAVGGYNDGRSENSSSLGWDTQVFTLNETGAPITSKPVHFNENDWVNDLCPATDSGFVAAGNSAGHYDREQNLYVTKGYVTKLTATGEDDWHYHYGTSKNDNFEAITPAHDGGYVSVGWTKAALEGADASGWIHKVSSDGIEQWGRRYGTDGWNALYAVVPTSDGGYLAVGEKGANTDERGAQVGGIAPPRRITTGCPWVLKLYGNGFRAYEQPLDANPGVLYDVVRVDAEDYLAVGYTGVSDADGPGWVIRLRPTDVTPPTVGFQADPFPIRTSETVTFDASESSDDDGSIRAYEWDLDGDGTFDASGVTTQTTFERPGTHEVILKVIGDDGAERTRAREYQVNRSKLDLARTIDQHSLAGDRHDCPDPESDCTADYEMTKQTLEALDEAVENEEITAETAAEIRQRLHAVETAGLVIIDRFGPHKPVNADENIYLAEKIVRVTIAFVVDVLLLIVGAKYLAAGAAGLGKTVLIEFANGLLDLLNGFFTDMLAADQASDERQLAETAETRSRDEVEEIIELVASGEIASAEGLRSAINAAVEGLVDELGRALRGWVEFGLLSHKDRVFVEQDRFQNGVHTLAGSSQSVYGTLLETDVKLNPTRLSGGLDGSTDDIVDSITNAAAAMDANIRSVTAFIDALSGIGFESSAYKLLIDAFDGEQNIMRQVSELLRFAAKQLGNAVISSFTSIVNAGMGFGLLQYLGFQMREVGDAAVQGREVRTYNVQF